MRTAFSWGLPTDRDIVPCRVCGGGGGDGHLSRACCLPSLVAIIESLEFSKCVDMDICGWPLGFGVARVVARGSGVGSLWDTDVDEVAVHRLEHLSL